MSTFADRVVLITGAASGIGRQLAHDLADEGAAVAALDRQPDALDALAAELRAKGRRAAAAAADVTDLAAVRAAVGQLESQVGPTDVLVACAGVGRETPLEPFDAAEFAATVTVNLLGVANSIDAVLGGMRERRRGHLVALSSL